MIQLFNFTCKGTTFLLNVLSQVGGEDLNHGLAGQLVHGVVLVVTPGKVSEHVPGQLVDPLDDLRHVALKVLSGEEDLQLLQLLVRDLALPLQLATALLDHGAQVTVSVHVLEEALGEALGSDLANEHGEDNEVEVTLNVVHNLGLEVSLPVVSGDIERHLGLDDALPDVLHPGAAWRRGGQVDQFVHLSLGDLGSRVGSQQLLDHLELSHLHGVPVLLHLKVNPGQAELLLLESIQNVVRDDSPHSVQLPGELELLHEGGGDHGGGGPADAGLAVEDDGAGGGGVLQHRHDLVEVGLHWGLLLVGGDSDGLKLGHLLLDGGVDLVQGGHSGQLLSQLLVGGPLLGVLAKLNIKVRNTS